MLIDGLHISTLYAFALVLARIAGIFVFLPLPGLTAGPAASRVVLSLVVTFSLFSRWPEIAAVPTDLVLFAGWLIAEIGFGLSI